jgi:ABC-type dipeptide/oligopeptide/nickel transport system ATPase component
MATIKAKIISNQPIDNNLKQMVLKTNEDIIRSNDDKLFIIIGPTGSGKSNLGLHMLDLYLGEKSSVDYVALNRSSFAKGLKLATAQPKPRCLLYDEANINKRESGTKFNREVMDLYMSIRGLNIFHIWCNPSLDMIDKYFIQERVKGVFFCNSKQDKIRPYYYFKVSAILEIMDKYKSLKMPLLNKLKSRYAYYQGWYRAYNGALLTPYLQKKEKRMIEKVDTFYDRWISGADEDKVPGVKLRKYLGVSTVSFRDYFKTLILEKKLVLGENYTRNKANRLTFDKSVIGFFENEMAKRAANCNNLKHLKPKINKFVKTYGKEEQSADN